MEDNEESCIDKLKTKQHQEMKRCEDEEKRLNQVLNKLTSDKQTLSKRVQSLYKYMQPIDDIIDSGWNLSPPSIDIVRSTFVPKQRAHHTTMIIKLHFMLHTKSSQSKFNAENNYDLHRLHRTSVSEDRLKESALRRQRLTRVSNSALDFNVNAMATKFNHVTRASTQLQLNSNMNKRA